MTTADRDAAMCALRKAGWTLREIGAAFNLSYQTVSNATWGVAPPERKRPIDRDAHQRRIHRGAESWRCLLCGTDKYHYSTAARFCRSCFRVREVENGGSMARAAVAKAIKQGEIRPPREFACVDCGCVASEYDHRDYSKPLDVVPVCRPCNARRGPGKWVKHSTVRGLKRSQIAP